MNNMIPRIRRLHCLNRRCMTTAISTDTSPSTLFNQTFKKVTAYPFSVNPSHAQALMDITAKAIQSKYIPLRAKQRLYEHWMVEEGGALSRLWSRALKPGTLRVKALYFPSWRIWSSFKFVVLQRDANLQMKSSIFTDKHLPGSDTPLEISSVQLLERPHFKETETVPLAECLDPFGLEVQCLPFTISPFALIDMAKAFPNSKSKLMVEGEIFLPASLSIDLFAAFPVMYPLYTCEYRCEPTKYLPDGKFTLATYAHGTAPRIAGIFPMWKHITNLTPDKKGFYEFNKYPLWALVEQLKSTPALRTADDASIRRMNVEEIERVERYLVLRKAYQEMSTLDASGYTISAQRDVLEKYNELRKRSDEYLPSWWAQSRLAEASTKAAPAEKKDRPLRSRSSPMGTPKGQPTPPPPPGGASKRGKRRK